MNIRRNTRHLELYNRYQRFYGIFFFITGIISLVANPILFAYSMAAFTASMCIIFYSGCCPLDILAKYGIANFNTMCKRIYKHKYIFCMSIYYSLLCRLKTKGVIAISGGGGYQLLFAAHTRLNGHEWTNGQIHSESRKYTRNKSVYNSPVKVIDDFVDKLKPT